jgi:hypothetical protein
MTIGRPKHRWLDNIKMYLQKVECGGMGLTDVAQDKDRFWVLGMV